MMADTRRGILTRVEALEIRTATLADFDAVQEVFRRASLFNEGDRPYLLAYPDALELSDTQLREGRTRVGCLADGRLVGFITTEAHADHVELVDLFVDPTHMRKGIGRALLEDVVSSLHESEIVRIEVTANRHSLDFYRDVGFVIDGTLETRFDPGFRMHRDIIATR